MKVVSNLPLCGSLIPSYKLKAGDAMNPTLDVHLKSEGQEPPSRNHAHPLRSWPLSRSAPKKKIVEIRSYLLVYNEVHRYVDIFKNNAY